MEWCSPDLLAFDGSHQLCMHDSEPHVHPGRCRVRGVDYVEIYAGNARQAAHFYQTAFGFQVEAHAGPETGIRDRRSYLLRRSGIRLVVTSAMTGDGLVAEHFNRHGESVKDVALHVDDAAGAFEHAVAAGASAVCEPFAMDDERGRVVVARIATVGDTVHSLIQRDDYRGVFLPGFVATAGGAPAIESGLENVDHLAVAVEPGTAEYWVEWYGRVFGLQLSQVDEISSGNSGMLTRVVRCDASNLVLVIVEPAAGLQASPIDEFLQYNDGPGIHHVAVSTNDIVSTIRTMRAAGVEFAGTPATYYDTVAERVGHIAESVEDLREQSILVDRDEWGYLLQIFAKPMQTRPTWFFEVIQRAEARGFGNGNIKALYEAIEREQAARGNA